jgi:hypothetical protein
MLDRFLRLPEVIATVGLSRSTISCFGSIQPARLRAYTSDALRGGPTNDGFIQRLQHGVA